MARAAGNTAPGALDGRRAIPLVLAVIAGALSAVLIDPLVGLPIAGSALAGLAYGRRVSTSVVAGLLGGLLAGFVLYGVVLPLLGAPATASESYAHTAIVVASLLVAGPVTAVLMKSRSAAETAVAVTGALTALSVVELAVYAAEAGQSVSAYVEAMVGTLATQMDVADELIQSVVSMWPSALIVVNGLTAMLVVAGVGVMGVRFGIALKRIPPLATFDLDIRTVILPIAAIALLAAGRLPVDIAPSLEIVGKNLLMVARLVFFLQGVAAFAGLYERAKFARPVRLMGFALLGVTEMFAPAVSLTGLADMWLNLRRLPRDASASRRPGATPDKD